MAPELPSGPDVADLFDGGGDDLFASGGKPWQPAQDHGFMYGTSFTDPDGHVWETIWMDASAAL